MAPDIDVEAARARALAALARRRWSATACRPRPGCAPPDPASRSMIASSRPTSTAAPVMQRGILFLRAAEEDLEGARLGIAHGDEPVAGQNERHRRGDRRLVAATSDWCRTIGGHDVRRRPPGRGGSRPRSRPSPRASGTAMPSACSTSTSSSLVGLSMSTQSDVADTDGAGPSRLMRRRRRHRRSSASYAPRGLLAAFLE